MKIVKVELKHFGKFKHSIFDLSNTLNPVLEGKNGEGKSTVLAAINWCLTGKPLSNDIDSIVPVDHIKGDNPEVTLYTDNGRAFTRIYKVTHDSKTGLVNGHNQVGKIDGQAEVKKGLFDMEIQEAFNVRLFFTKLATKCGLDELQLFTREGYAFKELDYKNLRELVISLGANVEYEDVYNYDSKLEPLKEHHIVDYFKSEKDYHCAVLEAKKNIEINEAALSKFIDVNEFDESVLTKLREEQTELLNKKAQIKSSTTSETIAVLENELINLNNEINLDIEKRKSALNIKLAEMTTQLESENRLLQIEKTNRTKDLTTNVENLSSKLANINHSRQIYLDEVKKLTEQSQMLQNTGISGKNKKSQLLIKIASIQERQFTGMVTCPHCNQVFPADQSAYEHFEETKRLDELEARAEYDNLEKEKISLYTQLEEIAANIKKANSQIAELNNQYEDASIELHNAKSALQDALLIGVDNSKVLEIESQIRSLGAELGTIQASEELLSKMSVVKAKIVKAQSDDEAARIEMINPINEKLFELEDKINEAYTERASWMQKNKYIQDGYKLQAELNDKEYLYALIKQFNNTYIALLNKKATELFGFEFTMLETQMNGEPKKVCYLNVDGVPINNVNTSEASLVGIKFINRIKEILRDNFGIRYNDLPILVDRAEMFDDINKIKGLEGSQIISTKVGTNKEIEIR